MTHGDYFGEYAAGEVLHLDFHLGVLIHFGTKEDNGLVRKGIDHMFNHFWEMHADHVWLGGEVATTVLLKQLF